MLKRHRRDILQVDVHMPRTEKKEMGAAHTHT